MLLFTNSFLLSFFGIYEIKWFILTPCLLVWINAFWINITYNFHSMSIQVFTGVHNIYIHNVMKDQI